MGTGGFLSSAAGCFLLGCSPTYPCSAEGRCHERGWLDRSPDIAHEVTGTQDTENRA